MRSVRDLWNIVGYLLALHMSPGGHFAEIRQSCPGNGYRRNT